jgi:hypothetical protein
MKIGIEVELKFQKFYAKNGTGYNPMDDLKTWPAEKSF